MEFLTKDFGNIFINKNMGDINDNKKKWII